MKSKKSKNVKKVEKFNEALLKTINSGISKLQKTDKMCLSASRIRVNKNIIFLKISDTKEIVESNNIFRLHNARITIKLVLGSSVLPQVAP